MAMTTVFPDPVAILQPSRRSGKQIAVVAPTGLSTSVGKKSVVSEANPGRSPRRRSGEVAHPAG